MSGAAAEHPRVLDVRGITVRYGQLTAVQDLSLDVRRGELVVLLGANGAGKSSLLRALMGIEKPAAGSAISPRAAESSRTSPSRRTSSPA